MSFKKIMVALMIAAVVLPAAAIDSHQPFKDPKLQARYESLNKQFRCLVCQNETIADSNADLAGDLRGEVYKMLAEGKTDQQIKNYMVDRYGDFVLYKPPVQDNTILLWAGPFILLALALGIVFMAIRRRVKMDADSVSGGDE